MPTILTAAQILALRTGWINDHVDLRLEWGSAPAVNGSAAAGASSLPVDGLTTTGVIKADTVFEVYSDGEWVFQKVAADVTAVAGAATLTLTSPLRLAAQDNDPVRVKPLFRSAYNKRRREEYLTDDQIQTHAEMAKRLYAVQIADAVDREEALFKATAIRCVEQMVNDPGFAEVLYMGDTTNQTTAAKDMLDRLTAMVTRWRSEFQKLSAGGGNNSLFVRLYR